MTVLDAIRADGAYIARLARERDESVESATAAATLARSLLDRLDAVAARAARFRAMLQTIEDKSALDPAHWRLRMQLQDLLAEEGKCHDR